MPSRVSVIIATYNRAGLLSRAVQTVLAQTYQDLELIVVDDGSEDGTPEVLDEVDDPRLRVIRQVNTGGSAARNRGVAASRGEYVAFLDDDDEFLPRKLEAQVAFLDRHPEVGLVAGGYEYVDGQGALLRIVEPWWRHEELTLETWLWGCPFLLQSILLRRSWWDAAGGLDPDLPQAHDHDLFLRLAAKDCKMAWIHESVFRYRIYGENVSRNALRQTQCRIQMLDKFFGSGRVPAWAEASRSEWYGYHWALGGMHAYAVGQFEEAQQSLLEAIRCDPRLLDEREDVLIGHIVELAHSPLHSLEPREFVALVFEQLPTEFAQFKKRYRVARGRLAMRRFFEAHRRGEARTVLASVGPGVFYEPRWLRNRGVWSITARALVTVVKEPGRLSAPAGDGPEGAAPGEKKRAGK